MDCVSNISTVASSGRVFYGVLFNCNLFPILLMCPFAVSMYGGRCFMGSTASLVHLENYSFLMVWRRFWWTGLHVPYFRGLFWPILGQAEEEFFDTTVQVLFD